MKANLQIGRIGGIPLQFHWTFVLVLLWLVFDSWQPSAGLDWGNFFWLLSWVALVFVAVLAHEMGHAFMGKRMGVQTEKIVLYPIGGGAFLNEIPEDTRKEMWIALAGPGTNLLIALAMLPLLWWGDSRAVDVLSAFVHPTGNYFLAGVNHTTYLLAVFFSLNVLLGVFNLLPAFPLDGGRILRAVLNRHYPRTRATIMAASWGIGWALLLLALGFYQQDVFFALGALLILALAMMEIQVQLRRQQPGSRYREGCYANTIPCFSTPHRIASRGLTGGRTF
ncbi:MAG: M50 family metallopeptidase [Saprospiraceae bacterium]